MEAHAYDSTTLELEARGSEVQSYYWIHSEFRASLGYMMICLSEEEGNRAEEEKREKEKEEREEKKKKEEEEGRRRRARR